MSKSTYVLGLTIVLALLGCLASLIYAVVTHGPILNFGMIAFGVYVILVLAFLVAYEIGTTLVGNKRPF